MKIKQLEWDKHNDAQTPFGKYSISYIGYSLFFKGDFIGTFRSNIKAKQAAQEDF